MPCVVKRKSSHVVLESSGASLQSGKWGQRIAMQMLNCRPSHSVSGGKWMVATSRAHLSSGPSAASDRMLATSSQRNPEASSRV